MTYPRGQVNAYDNFGRLLYSGLITSSSNRSAMESSYSGSVTNESYSGNGPVAGYTNSNFTLVSVMSVNYYDNYGFLSYSDNNPGGMLSSVTLTGYDTPDLVHTKTMLTGTRIYHLDNSGLSEVNAIYYDKYGRMVQTRASNHLGGYDITYNHLDFRGKVLKTRKENNVSGQPVIPEIYRYAYDKAERLITTRYKLGTSDTITLATNSYDELGRLTTKLRHNKTDTEQYGNNVRNWTAMIKSGNFQEDIIYNYNGNISGVYWTYNSSLKQYSYSYDNLNRLTGASVYYFDPSFYDQNPSGSSSCFEYFNYDKMGNITDLYRADIPGDDIDELGYTYHGNQVTSIHDYTGSQNLYSIKEYQDKSNATNEMSYDANGNLIKDLDRDISKIDYIFLNLPQEIQISSGAIFNMYNATGTKLYSFNVSSVSSIIVPMTINGQTTNVTNYVKTGEGTAYIGNIEYKITGTITEDRSVLDAAGKGKYVYNFAVSEPCIYNSEGYVKNLSNPQYFYNRKDHLGNIREVWLANTGETVQRTQYYASGLPWESLDGDHPEVQNKKYNGKEFIEMSGYDTYDYGARGYYPAIGRFTSVDPLAERYYSTSPYVYCLNNPVNYIDPNGEFSTKFGAWLYKVFNGGGQTLKDKATGEYFVSNQVKYTGSGAGAAATRRFDWGGRSTGEKQYDQKYGETITGGSGSGSESTAQIHGPSIDASLLSYPLNSTATKGGQYLYELSQKIAALITNVGIQDNAGPDAGPDVDNSSPNPNETMQISIETVVDETYEWNNKVYHDYPHKGWKDSIIKVTDTLKVANKYKKRRTDSYIKIQR